MSYFSLFKNRTFLASYFGNALEFYDFTLYGVFAVYFAEHYFPSSSPLLSLISSLSAFAAGFFMRPVGSILFGHIGDKYGRKRALSLSILVMAIPTVVIAVLPTYEDIGILAPIILVLCRLSQGLSTGGEYNGSAIYALEHFGKENPGVVSSFITSSCYFGAIVATLLSTLMMFIPSPHAYRFTFAFGGILGLIVFFQRRSIQETPVFINSIQNASTQSSFLDALKGNWQPFRINFSLGLLNGALAFTLFGFSLIYLTKFCGLAPITARTLNVIALACCINFQPFMGQLYDKKPENYYSFTSALLPVLAFIGFSAMLKSNPLFVLFGQISLALGTAMIVAPIHVYMQRLVPPQVRYRVVALSFSSGLALSGGLVPIILTAVIDTYGILMAPAYILTLLSLITFGQTFQKNESLEKQSKKFDKAA